jgi:hypothetical protein
LIIGAILAAGIYAVIRFWPSDSEPPQLFVRNSGQQEPAPEPAPESMQSEAEVIANLVRIGSAELSFHGMRKRWGSFEELAKENLLSSKFSNGVIIHTYQYILESSAEHFACYADPVPGPRQALFHRRNARPSL